MAIPSLYSSNYAVGGPTVHGFSATLVLPPPKDDRHTREFHYLFPSSPKNCDTIPTELSCVGLDWNGAILPPIAFSFVPVYIPWTARDLSMSPECFTEDEGRSIHQRTIEFALHHMPPTPNRSIEAEHPRSPHLRPSAQFLARPSYRLEKHTTALSGRLAIQPAQIKRLIIFTENDAVTGERDVFGAWSTRVVGCLPSCPLLHPSSTSGLCRWEREEKADGLRATGRMAVDTPAVHLPLDKTLPTRKSPLAYQYDDVLGTRSGWAKKLVRGTGHDIWYSYRGEVRHISVAMDRNVRARMRHRLAGYQRTKHVLANFKGFVAGKVQVEEWLCSLLYSK
ncbi:hypothetical protein BKA70DRAFT_1228171 [Coprinopsis sp. MPI-PUGE-AT-0042]|nr:hypothetical protein BKA70DRAFT_1228171 [Coprinopsis sp. MPI-PUGE-AT-0042]